MKKAYRIIAIIGIMFLTTALIRSSVVFAEQSATPLPEETLDPDNSTKDDDSTESFWDNAAAVGLVSTIIGATITLISNVVLEHYSQKKEAEKRKEERLENDRSNKQTIYHDFLDTALKLKSIYSEHDKIDEDLLKSLNSTNIFIALNSNDKIKKTAEDLVKCIYKDGGRILMNVVDFENNYQQLSQLMFEDLVRKEDSKVLKVSTKDSPK